MCFHMCLNFDVSGKKLTTPLDSLFIFRCLRVEIDALTSLTINLNFTKSSTDCSKVSNLYWRQTVTINNTVQKIIIYFLRED